VSSSGLPILTIDFDGVIHDYKRGWQKGAIYGELTDGFLEWAERARLYFRLVVYSSRSSDPAGIQNMIDWLTSKGWDAGRVPLEFAHEKPPSFLTIDDRCIRFEGTWDVPELGPDRMRKFLPWMMKEKADAPQSG